MSLKTIAFLAAMVPATALARPNDQNANKNEPKDSQVQIDSFEWSMGQGRLGMLVMGLTPDLRSHFGAPRDSGLLVAQVMTNSPAARAGIQVGDVVTKIGTDKVDSAGDLMLSLGKIESNKKVSIEVVRDHKTMTLQATLGNKSSAV